MAETKYEARLKTLYNKEIAKAKKSWLPLVLVRSAKISVSLKP